MLEQIGVWILRLTGAAMVSAAAVSLTPKGRAGRVVRLACGLMSVSVLLGAAASVDGGTLFPEEAYPQGEIASAVDAEKAIRAVIEERAEAYISDKAASLGLADITVLIAAEKTDAGWYFARAEVRGTWDAAAGKALSRHITETLGIAEEDQEWISVE